MPASAIGLDCAANYPPGMSAWTTRRFVFDQARGTDLYTQPSVLTALLERESTYKDPSVANVWTTGIAVVRAINPAGPQLQIDPRIVDQSSGPAAGSIPPVPVQLIGAALSGVVSPRGVAVPQYRVDFSNGDNVRSTIFVDQGCVLSLPARRVSVAALTQPLLFAPTSGGIENPTATVSGGLVTEAVVSANIAWSKGTGSSAPQGMATYTQIGTVGVEGTTIFPRPPFGRRVQAIPPETIAGRWRFVSSVEAAALTALVTPPGVSNQNQERWDVPSAAVALIFIPTGVPSADALATVVWELGVR